MIRYLWLSLAVVVLDLASKQWASQNLVLHRPEPVLPMINLTLMHNTGAAFSLLGDAGGWQRWFFIVLALLISAVLVGWIRRLEPGQGWLALGLGLILGGAVGNLVDRVRFGYVVDFLDVYYGSWHWPAFNVADSAISIGVAMLVIDMLRGTRPANGGG